MYTSARTSRSRGDTPSRLLRRLAAQWVDATATMLRAFQRQLRRNTAAAPLTILALFVGLPALVILALAGAGWRLDRLIAPTVAVIVLGPPLLMQLRRRQGLPRRDHADSFTAFSGAAATAADPPTPQRWHHEILQIARCQSLDDLQRRSTLQAIAITQSGQPDALGAGTGDAPHGGRLSRQQSDGLELLHAVADLRTTVLEGYAQRERIQTTLQALWSLSVLARVPGDAGLDLMRDTCRQIASALRLDWVAVLAPDELHPAAPVLIAYANGQPRAVLSPTHVRIAAEALRQEQPLVRAEAGGAFVCLPVVHAGQPPLVVAACGDAGGDIAQLLLMLLGDVLARRFETGRAARAEEAACLSAYNSR